MSAVAPIFNHSGLVGDETVMALTALTNSATVATDGSWTPDSSPAPGVFRFVDKRDGIPIGYPQMTFSQRAPVRQSPVYRGYWSVVQPILESNLGAGINGVVPGPTVAYTNRFDASWQIAARSTLANRRVLLSYVIGACVRELKASDLSPVQATGSPFVKMMLDLEGMWGG